jgi:Flp pilus assembly protein TadG
MKIARNPHKFIRVLMRIVNGIAGSARANGATRFHAKRGHSRLRAGFRGDAGNALVEVALILPVLLSVLMGIFVVGIAFNNWMVLTNAVDIGGQYLATLTPSTTSDPCADTITQIYNAAGPLSHSSIKVTFNLEGTSEGVVGTGTTSCSGAQSNLNSQMNVTVSATYACNLTILGINYAPAGCNLPATITELGN